MQLRLTVNNAVITLDIGQSGQKCHIITDDDNDKVSYNVYYDKAILLNEPLKGALTQNTIE